MAGEERGRQQIVRFVRLMTRGSGLHARALGVRGRPRPHGGRVAGACAMRLRGCMRMQCVAAVGLLRTHYVHAWCGCGSSLWAVAARVVSVAAPRVGLVSVAAPRLLPLGCLAACAFGHMLMLRCAS